MTVDEIRAIIRLTTMVDSGEISDAQLLLWINECIWDVSMRDDWEWLETRSSFVTVVGTEAYDITSMASGDEAQAILYLVRSGDDSPLHPISWQAAMVRWGDDVPESTPKYYAIYRERIHLYPKPSAVETIRVFYVRPPSELSAGSDTPEWMTTFHNLVVPFVEEKVWRQQEDFQKAGQASIGYRDRLDLMRRAYQSRQNHGPWTVGAARSTRDGTREPYRTDWADADV